MRQQLTVPCDVGDVSDGFHTFNELYDHRILLFAVLCALKPQGVTAWRSKIHADGTMFDGWFIAGMVLSTGDITYHIPLADWHQFATCLTLEHAPEWDGHTPGDVEERLSHWVKRLQAER